ncbi:hypothetical protein SASPL_100381 [Salvia splendens]|uniref:Protein FAR1-RELATED SEQUENCE n=1 Tax=Salvia splendens TaxID=180675 RepID=A0A8X9AAW8_SALSN|nr:hypothetical protein SASPL_100381 [Salvia splendens]
MRIQRHEAGGWVVDRLQMEHNHALGIPLDPNRTVDVAPKGCREEGSSVLENLDLVETDGGLSLSQQAKETGFFYAVEMRAGKGMNLFWADARSRFSCAQFGDAIVFDTTYRRESHSVPFASFVGINHEMGFVLTRMARGAFAPPSETVPISWDLSIPWLTAHDAMERTRK